MSGTARGDLLTHLSHHGNGRPLCLPCANLVWPSLEVNPHDN